jgi:hypothetical protein
MYPHAADNLLLPSLVIYQFAFAEYLARNPPGSGISAYDDLFG